MLQQAKQKFNHLEGNRLRIKMNKIPRVSQAKDKVFAIK